MPTYKFISSSQLILSSQAKNWHIDNAYRRYSKYYAVQVQQLSSDPSRIKARHYNQSAFSDTL